MGAFQITAAIVSVCALSCLILFVILLNNIDPPPVKSSASRFPPDILRRTRDDLHIIANLSDEAKGQDYNVDKIVEDIVSSSLAHLNNASGDNVTEISNSFLTRLRVHLLEDIKRAIPRIIQTEDEVAKLQTKIDTKVSDQSFVANDDVVVINITDVLGQPLIELKLYSYKGDKDVSNDEDVFKGQI